MNKNGEHDKIINEAITKLANLTGEDFHGYRSEIWNVIHGVIEQAMLAAAGITAERDALKAGLAKAELALFENDKEKQENYKEKWRKRAVKAEAEAERLRQGWTDEAENHGQLKKFFHECSAKDEKRIRELQAELSRVMGITVEDIKKAKCSVCERECSNFDYKDCKATTAAIHRLYQGVK